MHRDDDMPARCCTAPEMPTATYSLGETVLPVCPTWSECGRQPASTTAREAPTVAPSAAASCSTSAKFSGPLRPRPPETITSDSVRSTLPPLEATTLVTRARFAEASYSNARDSTAAEPPGFETGANTLGRSV